MGVVVGEMVTVERFGGFISGLELVVGGFD